MWVTVVQWLQRVTKFGFNKILALLNLAFRGICCLTFYADPDLPSVSIVSAHNLLRNSDLLRSLKDFFFNQLPVSDHLLKLVLGCHPITSVKAFVE